MRPLFGTRMYLLGGAFVASLLALVAVVTVTRGSLQAQTAASAVTVYQSKGSHFYLNPPEFRNAAVFVDGDSTLSRRVGRYSTDQQAMFSVTPGRHSFAVDRIPGYEVGYYTYEIGHPGNVPYQPGNYAEFVLRHGQPARVINWVYTKMNSVYVIKEDEFGQHPLGIDSNARSSFAGNAAVFIDGDSTLSRRVGQYSTNRETVFSVTPGRHSAAVDRIPGYDVAYTVRDSICRINGACSRKATDPPPTTRGNYAEFDVPPGGSKEIHWIFTPVATTIIRGYKLVEGLNAANSPQAIRSLTVRSDGQTFATSNANPYSLANVVNNQFKTLSVDNPPAGYSVKTLLCINGNPDISLSNCSFQPGSSRSFTTPANGGTMHVWFVFTPTSRR